MIKLRRISKKRRNPFDNVPNILQKLGNYSDINFLHEGKEGKTYTFNIKNSSKLEDGKYLLKIIKTDELENSNDRKYLKLLSDYGLIPKIYIITNKYIIMKYIKSKPLSYFMFYEPWMESDNRLSEKELLNILYKVINQLKIWHKLKFYHGDLHIDNILIGNDKIYLIDPSLSDSSKIKDIDSINDIYSLITGKYMSLAKLKELGLI